MYHQVGLALNLFSNVESTSRSQFPWFQTVIWWYSCLSGWDMSLLGEWRWIEWLSICTMDVPLTHTTFLGSYSIFGPASHKESWLLKMLKFVGRFDQRQKTEIDLKARLACCWLRLLNHGINPGYSSWPKDHLFYVSVSAYFRSMHFLSPLF